jgi:hypothetical protein
MSALPPKADIAGLQFDVRFVPEAHIQEFVLQRKENPGNYPGRGGSGFVPANEGRCSSCANQVLMFANRSFHP